MPIYVKKDVDKDHSFTNFPVTISNNVKSSVSSWSVEGNGEQQGTPTPDNPVMPEFVGVRTGNLFDYAEYAGTYLANAGLWEYTGTTGTVFRIPCTENTVYTLSLNKTFSLSVYRIATANTNSVPTLNNPIAVTDIVRRTSATNSYSFTTPAGAKYILFQVNASAASEVAAATMLNLGSTALPYEPYGWAEKITCAGQTVPVYLGQVETTRRIKKLVLTGEEKIAIKSGNAKWFIPVNDLRLPTTASILWYCSHYQAVANNASWASYDYMISWSTVDTSSSNGLRIRDVNFLTGVTITDFKSYLAAQYAAGTPVTVWYVLSEPKTAIVNEPLCKIGDYADELLSTSEGTPQLTLSTEEPNLISFETDLQPSKFNIKYYEEGYAKIKDIQMQIPTTKTYNSIRYVLDNNNNYIYKSPYFYTWEGIREIVRAGKASQYYPIGSIIYDNFNESTGTAFQVVAYDNHFDPTLTAQGYTHSMTLCELLLTDVIIFDEQEAFLYTEVDIPAGTYKFTIPNYDVTYGGNKTYYFTSTSDLPVESQLVINWPYNQTPKTVTAYSPSGTTLVQNITTATSGWNDLTLNEYIEGTSPAAIDLGTIAGPSTQLGTSNYGEMNHIHRARYGSNNYLQSGIRQYINSNSAANTWWEPQTIFDRPYTTRTSAGKLTKLDSNLVNVMAKPEIESRTNSYFETTSLDGTTFTLATDYSITNDKMFLLAPVEVGFSTTDTTVGTLLDYYSEATDETRIKKRKSNNTAYYWWLRTPYPSGASSERYVFSSGALDGGGASYSRGVAAACVIQ